MNNVFKPGDYIRYILKNELGKIKRINPIVKEHAFCWYHEGDTAASTPYLIMELVLSAEEALVMQEEDVKKHLHDLGFSNDYAINKIVEKKEDY